MSLRTRHNRPGGFTLVELLISLVIVGMLFAAIAAALSASAVNYRENEQIYRALNSARQALERMTNELRTAGADVNGIFAAADPTAPNNQCNLFTAAGQDITYEYRSADNKLYLITNSNGNEYVLCDNVTNAVFIKTPTDDGSDVKSVRISLTVESGDQESTLSAAVIIRKNL